MLEQRQYRIEDPAHVRRLVAENAWALLVSAVDGVPVVSHLPVLLDPGVDDLTVVSHLAAPDADLHRLGESEAAVVVQGPHGYLSPRFYEATPYVPTWDFVVVHLHGRPEVLDADATYRVLSDTVDHFEKDRPDPFRLADVASYAHSIAPGATGFRLRPTRVVAKAKLSQDKPAEVIDRVIAHLDHDPVHAQPRLADAMRTLLRPGSPA